MKSFDTYIKETGEVGYVEEVLPSIVYVSGLPRARPFESIIFETGDVGEILGLGKEKAEVLLFTTDKLRVGTKAARSNAHFQVPAGEGLLGMAVNSLGDPLYGTDYKKGASFEKIDISSAPPGMIERKEIDTPLQTGVALVDMAVPLAKGQRELVLGDRKTGKTLFLHQTLLTQARQGTICIYALIGKRHYDIKKSIKFVKDNGIEDKTVIVGSSSSDPAGLIFMTPYTAVSMGEYFASKGQDVMVILDDMTTHAKNYREISLLARRFPGRNSYPGDIFYVHARLMERAGNFKDASITMLPVAESILGDLSGYIQTNLMAMTDGHIFFDIDFFDQGRRPAVNPFLSVTRVGLQAQTPLMRDVHRNITRFLVRFQKMQEFLHFGAELGEEAKHTLKLGNKIINFFNQPPDRLVPTNVSVLVLGALWAGEWKDDDVKKMSEDVTNITQAYNKNQNYKTTVDNLIKTSEKFSDLVTNINQGEGLIPQATA